MYVWPAILGGLVSGVEYSQAVLGERAHRPAMWVMYHCSGAGALPFVVNRVFVAFLVYWSVYVHLPNLNVVLSRRRGIQVGVEGVGVQL